MKIYFSRFILVVLLLTATGYCRVQAQNPGDYGAITSGSWTTVSIWRQWNGSAWATVPTAYPSGQTTNVYILSGSIVTVPSPGPYNIGSLTTETGAKLLQGSTTQVYLSVWGANIVCNGEVGNGTLSDGLSFNIEGVSCTISGNGIFTASRIRKSAANNATTILVVAMDVFLRWSVSSATAIYNNVTSAASRFDITVNAGCTLNVIGSPSTPANMSIDGIGGGVVANAAEAAGTVTVNGTLVVAGILYAATDNPTSGNNVVFNIGNGGIIKANQVNSPNSATAGMTFNVLSGGKLELTGPVGFAVGVSWGTTSNRYNFLAGSTVEYSYAGNQNVLHQNDFSTSTSPNNQYWNLITSGSGNKVLRAISTIPLVVRGNINITGASVLDQATNNPDLQIGGNWTNYNQSGFNQSLNTTKSVKFFGNGATPNTAVQSISCTGGEIFTNLWIAKLTSASVKLLSPVMVTNQLTLGQAGTSYSGILDLNRNSLTLENSAASAITLTGIGSYNRYIICEDNVTTNGAKVRWKIGTASTSIPNIGAIIAGLQNFWPWPYMIPFGVSATSDTIPFGFYKPTPDNMGYLTVATYGTPPDNAPWPTAPSAAVTNLDAQIAANNTPDNRDWTADRFWYVGADLPVSGCGVAFLYDAGIVNPAAQSSEYPANENNPWNLRSQYWDGSAASWALPQRGIGVGPIPFIPFVIPAAVVDTGFNVWNTHWTLSALASPLSAAPLPVELLTFVARNAGASVRLDWITASEINNRNFTVERSVDGINFHPIGIVEGAGNSSQQHSYGYNDRQPLSGISYYRLKQTDFDGKFSYSDVKAVDRNAPLQKTFTLSPNPAGSFVVLGTPSGLRENLRVSITDLSGREVYSGAFHAGDESGFTIDLNPLSAGIYQVRVAGISANSTFRLVKE